MNLYFRLIGFLLSYIRGYERSPVLSVVQTNFRVYPTDLDTNLHMNNGRYLTLMDLGRLDLLRKTGLLWATAKRRWAAVLGATHMVYLRPLKAGDLFSVHTQIECWDAKWFVIIQRFKSREKTCAIGRVRGLFRGPEGNVPVDRVMALLEQAPPTSPAASNTTKLWLEGLDLMLQEEKRAAS